MNVECLSIQSGFAFNFVNLNRTICTLLMFYDSPHFLGSGCVATQPEPKKQKVLTVEQPNVNS